MNKLDFARVCVCLLLLLVGTVSHAQNNVIDEVVWVVGDEAILKSDVEDERLQAQYEGRRFDGDPYCVIPEELAIQKLYLHQAEIDSVTVSEQAVLQEVETYTAWLIEQIGTKEKMEEYYNKTSTQIREMLRENMRNKQIVQEMQRKIVGDIKLTPAEVRNYFSKLPADSIPYILPQVEVQIITLEPKVTEEEKEQVREQIKNYHRFEMLIRQGRYYRLTDVWQKKEYAAWEYCRPDGSEALVTVVTLDTQCNPATEYVKLRGLGEDKKYRVEVVGMQTGGENGQRINGTPNSVEPEYYTGAQLVHAGLPVPRLGNEYKSWQVYVKEV